MDIDNFKNHRYKIEKAFLQERLRRNMAQETLEGTITSEMINEEICRRLQDDVYDEYLVNGAVLTCTGATKKDFSLSDGDKVELEKTEEESGEEKPTKNLYVRENPLYKDDLCHATVKDTVQGQNISPFFCNCSMSATMEQEQTIKANIGNCQKYGVCQYLMDLDDEWENINFEVPYAAFSYAEEKLYTYDSSGNEVPQDSSQITSTKEGIMMTSVLFCKHGGFIYPLTSGQKISTLTEEEALDIMARYLRGDGISEAELANAINWLAKNCGLTVNNFIDGDFSHGEANKASKRFDNQIIAWTYYWNKNYGYAIDPNIVKAIIARESSCGRVAYDGAEDRNPTRNVMQSLATGNSTVWIAMGINPYDEWFEDETYIRFKKLDGNYGEKGRLPDSITGIDAEREKMHFNNFKIIKDIFELKDGEYIVNFDKVTPDMSMAVGVGLLGYKIYSVSDGNVYLGVKAYNGGGDKDYMDTINEHLRNMGCEELKP